VRLAMARLKPARLDPSDKSSGKKKPRRAETCRGSSLGAGGLS
jgi:hypothetical protein